MSSDPPIWSRSEELLQLLADRSPFVLFRYRVRPDPGFEFVSDAARRLYGFSPAEIYDDPDRLLGRLHEDDRARFEELLDGPPGEGPEGRVFRWRRRDGRLAAVATWTVPVGSPDGTYVIEGVNREITGWGEGHDDLPDVAPLLNALHDAVVYSDPAGTIRFYNQASEETFGWPPEEALGRSVIELLWPDNKAEAGRRLRERVLSGESITEELPFQRRDGSRGWIWVTASPVLDGAGEVEGVLGVSRDVTVRKAAERTLNQERARLDELLEASPAVVYTTEPRPEEGFATTFLTSNIEELTGYASERFTANADFWVHRVHPDDRDRVLDELGRVLDNGEAVSEYRFLCADGEYRWTRDSMRLIRDEEGQPLEIVGSWLDVSDRKQRELELDRFFSLSLDLLCIADLEGRFQRVNPAFTEVLGYSEEDLTGRDYLYFVHPDDREGTERAMQRLTAGQEVTSFENRYRTSDGSYRWLRWTAQPLPEEGVTYAVARDVTEERGARRALEDSRDELEDRVEERDEKLDDARDNLERALRRRLKAERRYRDIFEAVPFGLAVVDGEGRIRRANAAMEQIFGHPRSDLLEMPMDDLVSGFAEWRKGGDDEAEGDPFLPERSPDAPDRLHGRRTNGEEFPVEVDLAPVDDEGPAELLAVIRDVSRERKLQRQVLRDSKLEAVGTLAGGIAHDFNNLITPILTNAQLVLTGLEADDPDREELEEIRTAARRASELTRRILALGEEQPFEPRVVDLRDVVDGLEGMLRRVIREDVRIEIETPEKACWTRTDPGRMEQLLLNLAINARDAMPDGGELSIRVDEQRLEEAYTDEQAALEPGDYVQLAVRDTGQGMDEETRAQIFDPFFTTKDPDEGTGLGLANVRSIVEESGGHISVYSEPGRGTLFRVYLPLVREPDEEPAGSRSEVESMEADAGNGTVLVVEDDEAVRAAAVRILSAGGYQVLEADGPDGAVDVLDAHPGAIDLLLSDVVMPGDDGMTLAREVKGHHPDVRVVLMSGYAEGSVLDEDLLDEEEVEFIQKPFTPAELLEAVGAVLEREGNRDDREARDR